MSKFVLVAALLMPGMTAFAKAGDHDHDQKWKCTYKGKDAAGKKTYVRSSYQKDYFAAKADGAQACTTAGLSDCKLVGCYRY